MKRFPAPAAGDTHQLDDVASCLILLSKIAAADNDAVVSRSTTAAGGGRLFECRTCGKKFSSFQALGGHRASHNKPTNKMGPLVLAAEKPNKKTHQCGICGLEFAMGQALGGHMRRHRAAMSLLPAVATMKKSSAAKNRVTCLDLDLNLTPLENYDLRLQQLGDALQIV
ncbi:unnamed protein product [Linum tenue]|uniref:C2H2-type domain-containing protein n=2 Tax=Linum tenue TaxID=586396 RepID=A0AAV0N013_9ROSI|nr:unnamed protein product [Linum tenue]